MKVWLLIIICVTIGVLCYVQVYSQEFMTHTTRLETYELLSYTHTYIKMIQYILIFIVIFEDVVVWSISRHYHNAMHIVWYISSTISHLV